MIYLWTTKRILSLTSLIIIEIKWYLDLFIYLCISIYEDNISVEARFNLKISFASFLLRNLGIVYYILEF